VGTKEEVIQEYLKRATGVGTKGVWAKADANAPVPPAFAGSTVSFDVQWLATIRGRLGVLITDATLLYGTGGVAFGGVKNNGTLNQTVPGAPMDQSTTKTGFVVGGGVEHMFGPRWTARAEVRYVDLGSSSVTCPASTCPVGPIAANSRTSSDGSRRPVARSKAALCFSFFKPRACAFKTLKSNVEQALGQHS
jgi:outer membrane immunogenic protein